MSEKTLLEMAKDALLLAKKHGATEAVASVARSREVEIKWRDEKLEKLGEATTRGLGLQLFVDGRYSAVGTSDLRPDALDKFVEDSVAMARVLAKDDFRKLPEPERYAGRSKLNLELFDPGYDAVTPDMRRKAIMEVEAGARSVKEASSILSVSSGWSDSTTTSARVSSNGFVGEREGTSFWLGTTVTVLDPDGRRPEDWSWVGARFSAELPDARGVGVEAAERALACIGSSKGKSGKYTMVVENRSAGRLVGALLSPLSGRSLQQKQSFLADKLGKRVASDLLTIVDDPLVVRGFGSRLFDGDGFAAKKMEVIEKGILQSYFVDDYYGRKLGTSPTTGGTSNLLFELGSKSKEALLADAQSGLLVTGFLGGNSNGTTGEYSFGVQGFEFTDGVCGKPVAEMNISGNLLELFSHLVAVGNDPYAYSSTKIPTLVFEDVHFAGT